MRIARRLAVITLIVAAFGVGQFTTNGCAGLPTDNDFRFGRLTGRVTDATTGAAIAGARITVQDFPVTSNSDGSYEITALSTGRHTLVATANGYAEYRAELRINEGDQTHNISLRRP